MLSISTSILSIVDDALFRASFNLLMLFSSDVVFTGSTGAFTRGGGILLGEDLTQPNDTRQKTSGLSNLILFIYRFKVYLVAISALEIV